jgi:predicted PurR-regulated permease PerM
VIIIAGITQARPVVVLFLVSIFLAILGAPPVLWLERKRAPYTKFHGPEYPTWLAIVGIGLGLAQRERMRMMKR